MNSDFRIPPKKSNKKPKKPLYRPPPVLTENKPPVQSEEPTFPEYRHQFPEETNTDYNVEKVREALGTNLKDFLPLSQVMSRSLWVAYPAWWESSRGWWAGSRNGSNVLGMGETRRWQPLLDLSPSFLPKSAILQYFLNDIHFLTCKYFLLYPSPPNTSLLCKDYTRTNWCANISFYPFRILRSLLLFIFLSSNKLNLKKITWYLCFISYINYPL